MAHPRSSQSALALSVQILPVVFIIIYTLAISDGAPSLQPKDWEETKSSTTDSHNSSDKNGEVTMKVSNHNHASGSGSGRGNKGKTYMVDADELSISPAYEQSVNPFLFHLEQGWRLKPNRHRYLKKKAFQQQQQITKGDGNAPTDDLPVDPNRPHFMDSGEAADAAVEENRAFGDEEKDLREFLDVLFSDDY